ncbi:hypothetical protein D3C84_478630 [compost metagenome]
MDEALEYQVAPIRAISMQAQGGKGQGMCGVVGQVEAAGKGKSRVMGVFQTVDCGAEQSVALLAVRWFGFQAAASYKVFQIFFTAHPWPP